MNDSASLPPLAEMSKEDIARLVYDLQERNQQLRATEQQLRAYNQQLEATHPLLAERLIFVTGGTFTPKAREYLSQVDNLCLEKPFDVSNFKKIVSGIRSGSQRGDTVRWEPERRTWLLTSMPRDIVGFHV